MAEPSIDLPEARVRRPDPATSPAWRPSRYLSRWIRVDPAQGPATSIEGTPRPAPSPTFLRDLAMVLVFFLVYRGLLFGVDYIGRDFSERHGQRIYVPQSSSTFWESYIRSDSFHFHWIITRGYRIEPAGPWKGMSTDAAFLPLYPYAVKALAALSIPGYGKVFPSHWPAGLLISNVATVLALAYILRIARMYLDEDGARRGLCYMLAFPVSFFLSSFYSEGLFLLTTSASFYHFLKGQYARAGIWGFLAATTRSPGIMLLPAFALGHLWESRLKLRRSDLRLAWLGLIPCGLAAVMAFFYVTVGDPTAFSKAHAAWGRHYTWPHQTLLAVARLIDWSMPARDYANHWNVMDFLSSLAFLALPLLLLKGFHKALPIYAMLMILLPLSTGLTMSIQRCELVVFPSFFALAKLGESRRVDRLLLFGFGLLLCLMKLAFTNGFPVV